MRSRLKASLVAVWLPVLLAGVWWFASSDSTDPYFPPLHDIVGEFRTTWNRQGLGDTVVPSLRRFAGGFALSVAAGVIAGVVLGLSRTLYSAVAPIVDFLRSIPAPALLPPFIAFLGFGDGMKVGLIAFGSVWPVLLGTVDGVRGVDSLQLDVARAYGLGQVRRIRSVILPAASPQIFAGIQVGLAIALALTVVSEMTASTDGIGFFILSSQQSFAVRAMWAGILILGLIGLLANLLLLLLQGRVLAWHRGWRALDDQQRISKRSAGGRRDSVVAG